MRIRGWIHERDIFLLFDSMKYKLEPYGIRVRCSKRGGKKGLLPCFGKRAQLLGDSFVCAQLGVLIVGFQRWS